MSGVRSSCMLFFECLVFCLLLSCVLGFNYRNWPTSTGDCEYDLTVNSDSPVTLDIPITFHAVLQCASAHEQYAFVFQDNLIPSRRIRVDGSSTANVTIVYSENIYRPGTYLMKVSAFLDMWNPVLVGVATRTIPFVISDYIPITLNITDVKVRTQDENFYISSESEVNITVNLHYPRDVYPHLETSYSWNIDKEQYITVDPYITYNFSQPCATKVFVSAVARVPVYDVNAVPTKIMKYQWGYFKISVVVKDPVRAVNLTGNTYLKHGQLLNLEVSCSGSGPFEYCWKILKPFENSTNLTCSSPVVTTRCFFPIIYYFHQSGNYRMAIFVDNFVTTIQRNFEVRVYDVSLKPQLSTVILPLFCTVLAIVIIAAGIVIHTRRNRQYNIETADFDFLETDAIVVETFWEKMYHSILQVLRLRRGLPSNYYLRVVGPKASNSGNYGSVPE